MSAAKREIKVSQSVNRRSCKAIMLLNVSSYCGISFCRMYAAALETKAKVIVERNIFDHKVILLYNLRYFKDYVLLIQ